MVLKNLLYMKYYKTLVISTIQAEKRRLSGKIFKTIYFESKTPRLNYMKTRIISTFLARYRFLFLRNEYSFVNIKPKEGPLRIKIQIPI